jgi:hypothetical protein
MKFLHKAGPAYIHIRIGASPAGRAVLVKKRNKLLGILAKTKTIRKKDGR